MERHNLWSVRTYNKARRSKWCNNRYRPTLKCEKSTAVISRCHAVTVLYMLNKSQTTLHETSFWKVRTRKQVSQLSNRIIRWAATFDYSLPEKSNRYIKKHDTIV